MGRFLEVRRADIPHVISSEGIWNMLHQALQFRRRYNEPLVFPGTGHLPDTNSDGEILFCMSCVCARDRVVLLLS